jgi:predicted GNAT family N-acyltransferase
MLRIELLPWEKARVHAAPIRFTVFVEEQGVPREIELDEHDASSMHAVAFEDDVAVGTGRLLPDGHIGRMAVLAAWRGKGVGSFLFEQLMLVGRGKGLREIVLSAQVSAIPFYRRHGFAEQGAEYMEAGIRHQNMRKAL